MKSLLRYPFVFFCFACAVAVVAASTATPARAVPTSAWALSTSAEQRARDEIATRSSKAFEASDFAALEAMAQEFRAENAKTKSGSYRLTWFYAGIALTDERLGGRRQKAGCHARHTHDDDDEDLLAVTAPRGKGTAETRFAAWMKAFPRSVAAPVALAETYAERAQAVRGTCLPDTVQAGEWAEIKRLTDLSRATLESHPVAASDTRWFTVMAQVARLQGWPREAFQGLWAQALKQRLVTFDTYDAVVVDLLPQWGGSFEAIEQFAGIAAARQGASETGDEIYARIYLTAAALVAKEESPHEVLKADWPRLKAGLETIYARYRTVWNANLLGNMACLYGDKDMTRKFIDEMDDLYYDDLWRGSAMSQCAYWMSPDSKMKFPPSWKPPRTGRSP